MNLVGNPRTDYLKYNNLNPLYRDDRIIQGNIIYIDHFGNAITNITKKFFDQHAQNRNFRINLRKENFTAIEINQIHDHYFDIVTDFKKKFLLMVDQFVYSIVLAH
ncbi:S-adenosyl-l-methionine hydroxide adenosyltransferase [Weeksella virosa]|uniref:SAM hydroxide adenosyltransferase n=1 Tax=Weeksella virosa TaxID=1014 RepID=UPI000E0726C3|nr:SAM hydroxide adenosyltransferase [Weeksella virosa]SUP52095.1 S-adenosyl-l-methionine hydroxide adenosyltransferase [Weeksella virosa]